MVNCCVCISCSFAFPHRSAYRLTLQSYLNIINVGSFFLIFFNTFSHPGPWMPGCCIFENSWRLCLLWQNVSNLCCFACWMSDVVFCAYFLFCACFLVKYSWFLFRFLNLRPWILVFLAKCVLFCLFFFVLCGYAVIFALVFELAKR